MLMKVIHKMKNKRVIFSEEELASETRRFMVLVYAWMSFALIITGITAYAIASSPEMVYSFSQNRILMFLLFLFEIVIVMILVGGIKKMSSDTAVLLFIAYASLNGFTLSVIFLVFTTESIASAFFITAGTFAVMSVIGYFTKCNLTSVGNLLFMGLLGLVIATFINVHYQNEEATWIITYLGVLIFTGLTAYDTQKIKEMILYGQEGTEEEKKEAIIGALTLYLDFVNLFLKFLNIFGKRK